MPKGAFPFDDISPFISGFDFGTITGKSVREEIPNGGERRVWRGRWNKSN